jgi:PAS domain S-box-containing protein
VDTRSKEQLIGELDGLRKELEALQSLEAGRERVDEQLRVSRARYEGIIGSAMDAIITIDEGQRITVFNRAAEQMFMCPAGEAIGQPLDRFIPGRFREAHREHVNSFGRTKVTSRRMGALGGVVGLRANEEEFPVEASISQLEVSGKKIFTVILRDTTGRVRAEERETRLGRILEDSLNEIYLFDVETLQFLQVNRGARENLGYTMEELRKLTPLDLKPEFTPDSFEEIIRPLRTGERQKVQFTTVHRRKDGSLYPVDVHLQLSTLGSVPAFIAIILDMTELKRMQEQLRHTERLAELGTLASGMAHEIGTPMNVILGRAEYLMQRSNEGATKKGLETIVTQVERITRIMNQLLTIARRRPVERRAMDLRRTVEDSLEIVQEQLRRRRIKVEASFGSYLPKIHADPDHMSQVLLNLILNAIHAMPEGGSLRIDVAPVDSKVKLVVADTGCGIAKEDLPKIFDPFFTTKEIGKGTGLGLTVVHGIMQDHGGSIEVTSELGHGTTFTLTLPAYSQS